MKKDLLMKILAIIASIVTVYVLIFWEPETNTVKDYDLPESKVENYKNNVDNDITNNDNLNNTKEDKNSLLDNTLIEGNDEQLGEIDSINRDLLSEQAIVTVDINTILEQLNVDEKSKINDVLKKLSVIDYSKFITALSNKESDSGVVKAFQLLKRRLSIEDYNTIRELLERYVDFSSIDV